MKAPRRSVDGVLLLDKPLGLSSNTALQRVKRLYNAEKAGHSGTLDPLATGLLPILLGEATKFGNALLDSDKAYVADAALGVRTATGDSEGAVLERRPVDVGPEDIAAAVLRFRGGIEQIPPMYSALKRDGKALYEYARAGETVERKARAVTIHELRVEQFASPRLRLYVRCSKGTYIRTLVEDLGEALGCGAHLAGLRRVGVGLFELGQAFELEQLENRTEADRDACLLPLECLFEGLPRLRLDAAQTLRFSQGQRLAGPWPMSGRAQIIGDGDRFLGLGDVVPDGSLYPSRLLRAGGLR